MMIVYQLKLKQFRITPVMQEHHVCKSCQIMALHLCSSNLLKNRSNLMTVCSSGIQLHPVANQEFVYETLLQQVMLVVEIHVDGCDRHKKPGSTSVLEMACCREVLAFCLLLTLTMASNHSKPLQPLRPHDITTKQHKKLGLFLHSKLVPITHSNVLVDPEASMTTVPPSSLDLPGGGIQFSVQRLCIHSKFAFPTCITL